MTISDPAIAHLVSEKSASSGSDAAPAGPASILSRASLSHASLHMMPRSRRKWTPSEDARLAEAVEQARTNGVAFQWREVAKSVEGRTNKDCRKRWCNVLDQSIRKGGWTESEDERLTLAVNKHGAKWATVAEAVQTRSSDQCSSHWTQSFNPDIDMSDWKKSEDVAILRGHAELGRDWKGIASTYVPGRTPLQVKNRYMSFQSPQSNGPRSGAAGSRDLLSLLGEVPPTGPPADADTDESDDDDDDDLPNISHKASFSSGGQDRQSERAFDSFSGPSSIGSANGDSHALWNALMGSDGTHVTFKDLMPPPPSCFSPGAPPLTWPASPSMPLGWDSGPNGMHSGEVDPRLSGLGLGNHGTSEWPAWPSHGWPESIPTTQVESQGSNEPLGETIPGTDDVRLVLDVSCKADQVKPLLSSVFQLSESMSVRRGSEE